MPVHKPAWAGRLSDPSIARPFLRLFVSGRNPQKQITRISGGQVVACNAMAPESPNPRDLPNHSSIEPPIGAPQEAQDAPVRYQAGSLRDVGGKWSSWTRSLGHSQSEHPETSFRMQMNRTDIARILLLGVHSWNPFLLFGFSFHKGLRFALE